jgi:hypothetical protein
MIFKYEKNFEGCHFASSPLSQASASPRNQRGGGHSPGDEGIGESQFGRLERKLSTLSSLCMHSSKYPALKDRLAKVNTRWTAFITKRFMALGKSLFNASGTKKHLKC